MAYLYVILLFNTVVQAHWFPWWNSNEVSLKEGLSFVHSKQLIFDCLMVSGFSLVNLLLLLCYSDDPCFGLVILSIVVDLVQIPDEVSTLLRVW